MIQLRYITLLEYPSTHANRLQVIKMAEAFSSSCGFELWVKNFPNNLESIYSEYGVRAPINIKRLGGVVSLWPKSFWAARALSKEIEKEPAEAVFFIRDILLAFFLTLFSKSFGKNFVLELHSLGKFPSFIYGRVFRSAKKIVSTNTPKKKELEKRWGIASKKIFVAPNGVDLRLFENLPSKEEARREFGLPLDKKIVIYTGSEQKWKGTNIIEKLASKFPEVLFVKVGGSLRVPYAKLPRMLVAADVLLVTAKEGSAQSEKWTSPIKLPTYMASGVPIVAPRTPSVQEFVGESSAFLGDHAEMIKTALEQNEEAHRRATSAKQKVQEFSWKKRSEKILAFIQTN